MIEGASEQEISTHTPLTGCNQKRNRCLRIFSISTHTPLTGCNHANQCVCMAKKISTHTPLTGCNYDLGDKCEIIIDFYSHTPHGVQHAAKEEMDA